jgi:hypothetical protein
MPGTTPEMGIVYPCEGENIDPGVFATYADTTQAAISEVEALEASLLRPPAVFVRRASAFQSIAAGASTSASFEGEGYDTDNMFTLVSPAQITVQSAGTYVASYNFQLGSQPTTLTSTRLSIQVNGVEFAYEKSDEGTGAFNSDDGMWISALLPSLLVGDVITFVILFTGTGNLGTIGIATVTRMSII